MDQLTFYRQISVYHRNGTVEDIAVIDGSPSYNEALRRLAVDAAWQSEGHETLLLVFAAYQEQKLTIIDHLSGSRHLSHHTTQTGFLITLYGRLHGDTPFLNGK
jgi:hypothetical protein